MAKEEDKEGREIRRDSRWLEYDTVIKHYVYRV